MSEAFAFFDGERGHLTVIDDNDFVRKIVTVNAAPGGLVRIDDGQFLPLLRYPLGRFGVSLRRIGEGTGLASCVE
jgi:hypothetical protein